jgi:hypothetical protein
MDIEGMTKKFNEDLKKDIDKLINNLGEIELQDKVISISQQTYNVYNDVPSNESSTVFKEERIKLGLYFMKEATKELKKRRMGI